MQPKPTPVMPTNWDEQPALRFGWTVMLSGFVGFMLFAGLVPLDKGAPVSGTVTVSGNKKTIQHPYGGVIERIHVSEGDQVKAGQTLISMNNTRTDAEMEIARSQWITYKALYSRLNAELQGKYQLSLDPWLIEHANDDRVVSAVQNQYNLLKSRKAAFDQELQGLKETERALEQSLLSLQKSLTDKKAQVQFSEDQLNGMRTMANEGYLPKNKLLDAEKINAAVMGSLADDNANMARIQGQLAEIRLRMGQRRSELSKELQTQLTDTQRQCEELDNRIRSTRYDNAYQDIKSPVDGYISNLQVFTQGGVISPGSKLMDVVPLGEPLEIQGQLSVLLVDKVRKGMPVDISFPAFNQRTTPHVPGVLTTVSADRLTEERTGTPYYLVKVRVSDEGMKTLSHVDLQPGMPAEMLIKNGERTLLNYLFRPIVDRLKFSFYED